MKYQIGAVRECKSDCETYERYTTTLVTSKH